MRGLLALLLTIGIALVAGTIGYQIGISSAVASAAETAGTVVYHAGWGWGFPWFGFLLFPFFLFLLFGLLAFAFGGRRRGWGPGLYDSGPYNGAGPWTGDDSRRQWIADAHRRLHEEEAKAATTTDPNRPTTAG